MAEAHRIIFVEDREADAKLALLELERAGLACESRRVETEADFRREIGEFRPHLILADFGMPQYDGLSALTLARALCPEVPFIFLSGTIGEENAVNAVRLGATDYILKDRMARLAPAVKRALVEVAGRAAARAQLDAMQRRFDATFEQAAIGLAHTDLADRLQWVNAKFCEITGYAREELVGRGLRTLLHPDELASADEQKAALLERTLVPHAKERRFVRRDSSAFWGSVTSSVVRDAARTPLYFVHALEDISERRRMEEALRRAEQDYRVIFDNAVTGIFAVNVAGRVVSGNGALVRMLGYESFEELAGGIASVSRDVYVEPGARRAFREALLRDGAVSRFETQWRRKDGAVIWVSMSGRLVSEQTGGTFSHIGMVEDITERKRAERVRALEHAVTRGLAEAQDVSQALRGVMRTVCESEGWQCGRYFAADDEAGVLRFAGGWGVDDAGVQEFLERSRTRVFRRGEGLSGAVWQNGEPLWVNDVEKDGRARGVARPASLQGGALVFPLRFGGRTVGVLNFSSRDVRAPDEPLRQAIGVIGSQVGQFLERASAEAGLHRFRLALDSSADMILIIDPVTLRHLDVNETACRLLGYTREELLRMGPADTLPVSHADLEKAYAELIANPAAGASGMNSYYICKDGSHLPFESTRRAVRAGDGWVIVAVSRDIRARLAAERTLREREAGLRRAQVMARLGHVVTGPDGVFESWSSTLPELIGVAPDAVPKTTRDWMARVHPDDVALFRDAAVQAAADRQRKKIRYRLRHADGDWIHLRQTIESLRSDDAGGAPRWFTTLQDVTEQRLAEQELRDSEALKGAILASSLDCLVTIDEAGRVVEFNPAAEATFGWQREAILGKAMAELLVPPRHREAHYRGFARHLATGEASIFGRRLELAALRADGVEFPIELTVVPIQAGSQRMFTAFIRDLTERKKAEARIHHLAYYDQVTGLANRILFEERLAQHLKAAASAQTNVALVLVDVERFKTINDTFGREAGDELLRQIARRVTRLHGDSERLARLGGDQFGILTPEVRSEDDYARLTDERFREVFGQPFKLAGNELRVAAKAGIALFPADGATTESLFRNAEAALKKAKATGERYLFYRHDMTARVAEKLALENKLRRALENDEFVLHYQPKVDAESNALVGVEALIRWQNPELGLVPPAEFIPLMEETGLILQAGTWALRRAALDHKAWAAQGLKAPRIAVNVSAIQLRQRDFVAEVERAIREGLAPTAIDLEITESLVMEDVEANIAKLKALRDLGMNIAVDDFGTGYSSLGYLAKLPAHSLKIDRSFIRQMAGDSASMSLVSTIIQLAHSLRLKVVAEGVETQDQATFLRLLRCDELQGYLFGKPMPASELARRLT